MTRYVLTSLAVAGLAAGCRPKATIDDFRAGVPRQETVTADVPNKAQALTVDEHQAALKGLPADYWVATVGVSTVINGGAFFVGALVKTIISLPPTSLKDDVAVWGPGSGALEANNWKLTVTRIADHQFQWALEGQSKLAPASPFVTVLAGTHTSAVDDKDDPLVGFGSGSFTIDWNARQKLPLPGDDVGSATYSYARLPGATATVEAQFKQIKDRDHGGKLIDVDYKYEAHAGGSGAMDFAVDAAAQLGMADGHATVHSRWQATGAGRADATLSSSTLPGGATASECWNTSFQSMFFAHSWAPALDYGTEATDCVFTPAEYSKQ
jgi:hypothetical protein